MQATVKLTIGVPTFQRAWSLARFFQSLVNLDFPKAAIRIVFVDNLSTDDTLPWLRDFAARWQDTYDSIRIIRIRSNIAQARNLCVDEAKGPFLLFLDSDVLPSGETVTRLQKILGSHPKVAIAGIPYQYEEPTVLDRLYLKFSSPKPHISTMVGMGCTMIRSELFPLIGKFNVNLPRGEDCEFTVRARRAGYLAVLDPSIVLEHLSKSVVPSQNLYRWGFFHELIGYFRYSYLTSIQAILRAKKSPLTKSHEDASFHGSLLGTGLRLSLWTLQRAFLSLFLTVLYTWTVIVRFPKSTGEWHSMNPPILQMYGISFAHQFLVEALKSDLLGHRNVLPGIGQLG